MTFTLKQWRFVDASQMEIAFPSRHKQGLVSQLPCGISVALYPHFSHNAHVYGQYLKLLSENYAMWIAMTFTTENCWHCLFLITSIAYLLVWLEYMSLCGCCCCCYVLKFTNKFVIWDHHFQDRSYIPATSAVRFANLYTCLHNTHRQTG